MGQATSSQTHRMQTADGRERTWVSVVPEEPPPPGGRALVVMCHGRGGLAEHVASTTRWDQLAILADFVAVFPNGTPADESRRGHPLVNPQSWNGGPSSSLFDPDERHAQNKGVDDVGFLEQLIDETAKQTLIDPRRIFLAGHSNGAGMAYRFASERPELVAAVGVMAGHFCHGEDLAPLTSPVSLLAVSGDQDPFQPLDGGPAGARRHKGTARPARLNASDWARVNGLTEEPRMIQDDDRVTELQWGPNSDGTEVRWIVVKNHGHVWAGGVKSLIPAFVVGPKSGDFDATSEMWEFFKSHPKLPAVT